MDANELRRLLELAAKAAGYEADHWLNSDRMLLSPPVVALVVHDADGRLISTGWNPADDDGDSRRLEVEIGATVSQQLSYVCVTLPHGPAAIRGIAWTEPHNGDQYAATRLTVLRAAAAIGEATP